MKKFFIFSLFFLLSTSASLAQYQGYVTYVPAGTPVSVALSQTLSSEFTKVGEVFTASLAGPIYAGSGLVAGPGSRVEGTVTSVEPAGRGGKPGSIELRLTSIITPSGQRIPLSASIDGGSFKLEADGGRTSHLVKTTALGAGSGALAGLIGSAIGGSDHKGRATAIGTGIGGGIGLLGGALTKGKEFILNSGTSIPFRLDAPLQVAAPNPSAQQEYGQDNYGGAFADPNSYGQQQMPQNPYLGN